jgi:hypothetical protein
MRPDGSGEAVLDTGRWNMQNVSWSPNGRCLAGFAHPYRLNGQDYYGTPTLYGVMSAAGGLPNVGLPLLDCPGPVCGSSVEFPVIGPQWLPDGRSLVAYVRVGKLRPGGEPRFSTGHIFRMRTSGAGARLLLRRAAFPIVSPGGRTMATFDLRNQTGFIATSSGRRLSTLGNLQALAWVPRRR